MIKKHNLSDESVVRQKVHSGISKMAALVGMTLGPQGRSVLIERGVGEPLIVDDGRRVAENMKLDDPIEQLAVRVAYSVTRKTDEKVGDGTTTSMVLTHAILDEVYLNHLAYGGMVSSQAGVNEVDERIQEGKREVLEKLDKLAKPIKTEKDLIDVATVSSGDPKIGEIIGQMYWKLGKAGHITLEFNLLSEEIESEVVPGLRFTGAYAHPFMITNQERRESVFKDVHVLVVKQKDLDKEKVAPVAKVVQHAGKSSLVIIAPKFTDDFLKSVYATATKSKFNILCVRAPGLTEEHYKDIAVWTGGKYFSENDDVAQATKADLGYVEKIEVTDDTCMLINGKGDPKAVEARIKEVIAEADLQKVHALKQQRHERASALSGGVGVIKIGAPTDEERNWLKYKIEDAKHATKMAYREGVVEGGGMAFKKISDTLSDSNILKNVIVAPYERLKSNAVGKFSVPKGVIDPVLVEKAALENACSAASKLIRIGGAIAIAPKPTLEEAFAGILPKQGGGEPELIEDDYDNE